MTSLHLRMLKRLVSLETSSAADLIEIEFMTRTGEVDLSVSIYEVDDNSVTRARAEHTASFCNPPKEGQAALSMHGFPDMEVEIASGATRFAFTQQQHRNLNLFDAEELAAVLEAVIADRSARQRLTAQDEIRGYVRGRLEKEDGEWLELCSDKNRKVWRRWAFINPQQIGIQFADASTTASEVPDDL